MKSRMFWMLYAFMLSLKIPAMAAPGLINYQGRLTTPSGKPITTPFTIIFTFWNAETGGAPLGGFSDTDTVTADASGVYSTLIGDDPGTPIPVSIFNGDAVWLNVRINGEDLVPRKRIASVGYALRSSNADTLAGQQASAFMSATADKWVNTTGDTMTGALTVTGSSGAPLVNVTNSNAGSAVAIRDAASGTGAVSNNGGFFEAAGDYGRGVYGVASAEGAVTNYGGYFTASGTMGYGVYSWGKGYDFYAGGTGTNYAPFTGAHEVQFGAGFPDEPKPGLIVVTAGPSNVRRDEAGQVSISFTLPTVRLADRPHDKAVFGVLVRETPLPNGHWYKPAAGECFGAVNALGEGRVWVCSAAGRLGRGSWRPPTGGGLG